jgi:ADP-heptose:LPS heptosyltransferase
MRIVISNPDGIGDVVLRLPLFEALREAGHELLLICREPSRPLLERLGQGISVIGIQDNPYHGTPAEEAVLEEAPFEEARKFSPDLVVFAPYQWTVFEERLARTLLGVPRIRMNGHRYARGPNKGSVLPPSDRERVVPVDRSWHETLKNQAICRAILGGDIVLKDPAISISEGDIERGRACLREVFGNNSSPENFWIGCVGNAGDRPGNVRDWGRRNWAELLRFMCSELGMKVLLVGNLAERESLEAIRTEAASEGNIEVSAGEASDAEDLSRLLGLTWLARGYIGKDTGPMHIAAALQKPVVAVFGGGHWPQFTPAVTPSAAMTVGLPCIRCAWVCHLPESLCVKQVPVSVVKEAVAAIICGGMQAREARMIAPSAMLVEAAKRRKLDEPTPIQVQKK